MEITLADLRFCPDCGVGLSVHMVGGERRNHWFCERCKAPHYDYPMIVVTCFVACGQRLLWVQRKLEPQRGRWAIPGGFLECGETLAEGAARELHEEAGVAIPADQLQLYMTGTITFINQIYVAFRATVDKPEAWPGVESIACGFYTREECPWEQLAYPEVNDCIEQAYRDLDSGLFDIWQAEMTEASYRLRPVCQGME